MRATPLPEPRRIGDAALRALPAVAVATAVFAAAYANGSFGLSTRAVIAIVVWWALGLALVLRLWPLSPPPRAALAVGALLAGYAALALASAGWAPSAEDAFSEFNRATLLLGVFAVGVVAARRAALETWLDGLAIAVSAVAAVALVSRFFPESFGSRGLAEFLPAWQVRLAFPLGYWNGLAIFSALAVPLLLRRAVSDSRLLWRSVAVAPLPALAAVIFLASSRGGVATAVTGALVFGLLAPQRWRTVAALVAGGAGAAGALLALQGRDELVNGPLDAAVVDGQGRSAALLVALACLGAGALQAVLVAAGRRVETPRAFGAAAALAAAVLALGILVAAEPLERFDEFREAPTASGPRDDFVQHHLTSAGGSGRWQFWTAAGEQWREHRLLGDGAGSFESWWAANGSLRLFVRDAHSLYLETLGELGVLGLALLGAALVTGLVAGLGRVRDARGETRTCAAALTALVAAFALAAGVDWMWELTAVAALALLALGLLVGPATVASDLRPKAPLALGVAVVAAAWVVVCAQAVALLSQVEVERSRDASARGEAAAALEHARSAQAIQPWAATPHLQEALVQERLGRFAVARLSVGEALERDERDWRLWLTRARLDTRAGDVASARRSFARARALNPRSPIFTRAP